MKIAYHELLAKANLPDADAYVQKESQDALKNRVRARLTEAEPPRRRFPAPRFRVACILAAAMCLLTLTAIAGYYVSQEHTADLLRGFLIQGESRAAAEAELQVLEEEAFVYDLSSTVNGTTVTLESVMGYTSPMDALLYLKLHMMPSADFVLPEDLDQLVLIPELRPIGPAGRYDHRFGCSAIQATRREDGSLDVILLIKENEDLSSYRDYELRLQYWEAGETISRAPDFWHFTLQDLALPQLQQVQIDFAALAGMPIRPLEIALSPFGGHIRAEGYEEFIRQAVLAYVQEHYPHAELRTYEDWVQIDNLYHAGKLTLEEFEDINDFRLGRGNPYEREIALVYPDGSVYEVSYETRIQFTNTVLSDGTTLIRFPFFVPQDLNSACALRFDGVDIPLIFAE